MATGSYVYRDSFYGQRLILDLSRSGTSVSYVLKLQSTGSMYANVSWSLSGGVSRSGTTKVSQGAAFTVTLASGSFTQAAATTVSASATMFWGGTPKVSASVSASVAKPAAPTNLKFTRTGDTSGTLTFTKGARASSTLIQAKSSVKDWYNLATPTGSSQTVSGLGSDLAWWFRAKSRNAAGDSGYGSTIGPFYVNPKAPSNVKAVLSQSGVTVGFTNNARYKYGVEVQEDTSGSTWLFGNGTSGTWKQVTVPVIYGPDLRFRVRAFAGPASNRVWSAWSTWSAPVQGLQPPLAPSGLAPNGTFVNVDSSPVFSWRHNSVDGTSQESVKLRFRTDGGEWVEFTVEQATQSYTLTAPQWATVSALGSVIEWQAATKGLFQDYGAWSATATFTVVDPPFVSITSPVVGDDYLANHVTLEWSTGQADGFPQSAWQAELLDASGNLLEAKNGTGDTTSIQFTPLLTDHATYTVRVQAQAAGIWSDWEIVIFYVEFISPQPPMITGEWDDEVGGHSLKVRTEIGDPQTIFEVENQLYFMEAL